MGGIGEEGSEVQCIGSWMIHKGAMEKMKNEYECFTNLVACRLTFNLLSLVKKLTYAYPKQLKMGKLRYIVYELF